MFELFGVMKAAIPSCLTALHWLAYTVSIKGSVNDGKIVLSKLCQDTLERAGSSFLKWTMSVSKFNRVSDMGRYPLVIELSG